MVAIVKEVIRMMMITKRVIVPVMKQGIAMAKKVKILMTSTIMSMMTKKMSMMTMKMKRMMKTMKMKKKVAAVLAVGDPAAGVLPQ